MFPKLFPEPVNMLVPPEEKPKQPKKESKIEPAKEVVTIPQPSPVPTEESSGKHISRDD